MRTRAVIEQAEGMLMAERRIDADDVFAMPVAMSQNANIGLRHVGDNRRSGESA